MPPAGGEEHAAAGCSSGLPAGAKEPKPASSPRPRHCHIGPECSCVRRATRTAGGGIMRGSCKRPRESGQDLAPAFRPLHACREENTAAAASPATAELRRCSERRNQGMPEENTSAVDPPCHRIVIARGQTMSLNDGVTFLRPDHDRIGRGNAICIRTPEAMQSAAGCGTVKVARASAGCAVPEGGFRLSGRT